MSIETLLSRYTLYARAEGKSKGTCLNIEGAMLIAIAPYSIKLFFPPV